MIEPATATPLVSAVSPVVAVAVKFLPVTSAPLTATLCVAGEKV